VIIAPFLTCIPKPDYHVMMYNVFRPNAIPQEKRTLMVVVGNFLAEIPFDVQIPDTIECACVGILVIPMFTPPNPNANPGEDTDHSSLMGVSVLIFLGHQLSLHFKIKNNSISSSRTGPQKKPPSRFRSSSFTYGYKHVQDCVHKALETIHTW